MSLNDPLANVLSHINLEENNGKTSVRINHVSKLIVSLLNILKEKNYLGSYEIHENNRGGFITVHLIGSINKIGVIKPRLSVKASGFGKFERRFLPAHNLGFMIVTIDEGMMTHEEAIERNLGGKLLAYVY